MASISVRDLDLVDESFEPRVTRPHLSFSQVSMYLRCSMQYKFRYILGLKEPPKLPIAVGKGGHAALELNGRTKMRDGFDMKVGDLLDAASTFIDLESEEVEVIASEKGEAKDRALGALRVFHHRVAPTIIPAGVEIEFNLDLNDANEEPIRIVNGKIDLLTTDAAVWDYKFVRQARSQEEVNISPQLTLYSKVFHTLTGKFPRKVGYQMFLPGSTRTPPDSRSVEREPDLMAPLAQQTRFRRLAQQFREVERAIKAEVFIAVDDPKVCSWCGYRERCQGTSVDDFTAAKYRGEA